jgi:hypothetical protein
MTLGIEVQDAPTRDAIISSVRCEKSERHWRITVWNRGGNAGTLCVNASDGPRVVDALLALGTVGSAPTPEQARGCATKVTP